MSLPVFPLLRYTIWAIKQTPQWATTVNRSQSGGRLAVPLWPNNPLWKWEWEYECLIGDPTMPSFTTSPNNNAGFTDFQMIEGFYFMQRGMGDLFVYTPPDSQVGGSFSPITSITVKSNIVTVVCPNNFSAGMWAALSGLTTNTFLNGTSNKVIFANAQYFKLQLTTSHIDVPTGPDTGSVIGGQRLATPDSNGNSELTHIIGAVPDPTIGLTLINESVQELNGASVNVYVNGTLSTTYSIQPAATVAPYEGNVVSFSGTVPGSTDVIIATFPYVYRCAFSEDTQEYEQFTYNLWTLKSLKFEQIRVTIY